MRTFTFTDDRSNKFWNIEFEVNSYTVTFGKIGTKGQRQTKAFASTDLAKQAYEKVIAEKLGKGYVETTGAASAPPPVRDVSPLQRSLEDALAENPDDLASHSAYADYLMEHGDPRGEFIQVQLALEDASRPAKERTQLKKREAELLKKHAKEWLGDLGRLLVGDWSGEDKCWHYQFARGWLDHVRLLPFPEAATAVLAKSPDSRLLRRLEVVYDMRYHPFDFDEHTAGPEGVLRPDEKGGAIYEECTILPPLAASPYLGNLRVLKLGFSDHSDQIQHSTMVNPFGDWTAKLMIQLLKKCPRLEELYLNTELKTGVKDLFASPELGNLRVLQFYYGSDHYSETPKAYPLSVLAKNKSLKSLTTLRLHPGRDTTLDIEELDLLLRSKNLPALKHLQIHMTTFDNEAYRRITDSGVLARLETLDLGYGNLTDDGARLLAAAPDLKHLKVLDVSRNALTRSGIDALKETAGKIVAEDQHDPEETDYLYEVDAE